MTDISCYIIIKLYFVTKMFTTVCNAIAIALHKSQHKVKCENK